MTAAVRGHHGGAASASAKMTEDHQRPGGGGYQHQAAHALRASHGELLRKAASPADAQHVSLLAAELVEQAAH
jgi:hypothetical protein